MKIDEIKSLSLDELNLRINEYSKTVLSLMQEQSKLKVKIDTNTLDILYKDYRMHEFVLVPKIIDSKNKARLIRYIINAKKDTSRIKMQLKLLQDFYSLDNGYSESVKSSVTTHKILLKAALNTTKHLLHYLILVHDIKQEKAARYSIKMAAKTSLNSLNDNVTISDIVCQIDKKLKTIKECGKIKMKDILK
jgi:hypothetical protein